MIDVVENVEAKQDLQYDLVWKFLHEILVTIGWKLVEDVAPGAVEDNIVGNEAAENEGDWTSFSVVVDVDSTVGYGGLKHLA